MKKFYLLTTSLAMALSASATGLTPSDFSTYAKPCQNVPSFLEALKAPAASTAELAGDYECTFWDFAEKPAKQGVNNVTVAAVDDKTITLSGLLNIADPLKATVDFDAMTISLETQFYTKINANDTEYDLALVPHRWNKTFTKFEEVETPLIGKIVDGAIEFDDKDVFAFCVILNDDFQGYYAALDQFTMKKAAAEDDDKLAPWNPVEGKALYQDGWIITQVGAIDPSKYAFEVDIEQSSVNPNFYRVVDPYSSEWYSYMNTSTSKGYVVFDVTDPDCVIVPTGIYSGYSEEQYGKFFLCNLAGYIIDNPNMAVYDTPTVKELLQSQGVETGTYKDGIVTITDCGFGTTANPMGYLSWTDAVMTTIITMPEAYGGIGDISADESNAPVEYFNLQGQKVDNPAAGLYIRRQGNKAIKVIIK